MINNSNVSSFVVYEFMLAWCTKEERCYKESFIDFHSFWCHVLVVSRLLMRRKPGLWIAEVTVWIFVNFEVVLSNYKHSVRTTIITLFVMIRLNGAPSIYNFVYHFEKNNKADKETLVKSNKNISVILRYFHLNLNCVFFTCLCYAKLASFLWTVISY